MTRTSPRASRREPDPIHIFYSYSHEDRVLRDKLESHLAFLEPQELIKHWHDSDISAGRKWNKEVEKNLEAADVILLLISSSFGHSPYCREEMVRALERSEMGARVIPIIIRSVNWSAAPFKDLQVLGDPIMISNNRDSAWTDVAEGISKAISELIVERQREMKILDKVKPEGFRKETLSLEDIQTGASILCNLVERKNNFDPDLLLAVNQGGMVTAAVMNQYLRKPVGIVYTAVEEEGKVRKRVVKFVSLPHQLESAAPKGNKKKLKKLKPKNILVVDTKLKTAESAEGVQALLRQEYGQGVDIRYAIVLAYGGWRPSRWRVVHAHFRWPIQFRPKGLKTYVAYYTDVDPEDDTIREVPRPGWRSL